MPARITLLGSGTAIPTPNRSAAGVVVLRFGVRIPLIPIKS